MAMAVTWSKGSEKKNANAGSSLRPIHARYNVEQSRQFPSAISITRFPVPSTQFPPISHEHGASLELSVGLPDELPSSEKEPEGGHRIFGSVSAWDSADTRDGGCSMPGPMPVSVV
ncbi:uncharacterized protein TrAFT101_003168 [Trichoderma asperellum]|uniref:uncharacterized protein n=1 Tax=Trichoderma asperellum TaxID=101201 RepID=UPI0033173F6B|nr:hypothetical protein TrAFT101_003168 [Trichoderma asperellum]